MSDLEETRTQANSERAESATSPHEEASTGPGSYENEEKTSLTSKLRKALSFGELSLEQATLRVFVLSSICLMVALTLFLPLVPLVGGISFLRPIEVLLKLVGVSLVVALIARTSINAFSTVFAFVLIGALIVPTPDLIRLVLIATNSERTYEDLYVEREAGETFVRGNSTLAAQIITELSGTGILTIDPWDRKNAEDFLSNFLAEQQRGELRALVERRGALPFLEAIIQGSQAEWGYRYEGSEEFRSHLELLRSEGLIHYAYDDVNNIQPTGRGFELVRDIGSAQAGLFEGEEELFGVDDYGPVLELPGDPSSVVDVSQRINGVGGTFSIPAEGKWFRVNLGEGDFDLSARDPTEDHTVDPILFLARRQGDEYSVIYEDDDGGDEFDSLIQVRLEDEDYLLGVFLLSGAGEVVLQATEYN